MLRLEGIEAGYSAVPVLHGVSIAVDAGQFVSIVGPNGAGKTTLFKTISGTLRPTAGSIRFEHVDLLRVAAGRRGWKRNIKRIYEWLPVLDERRAQLAGTLSGGEQQMLAIGRGLASSPKLLMLDEPSMGLAPTVADFVFERLMEIRQDAQLTVLLVEQRVAEALESADHGYVLETGRVALHGTAATLRADDRVRQAYLGM